MSSTIKQVIIIGGGGAGIGVAREVANKVDPTRAAVTLISTRPYYTHMPATPRMVVSSAEDLEQRALVPLDRVFAKSSAGKLKIGQVVGVTVEADGKNGTVVLEDGETLHWDYLVLATGSKWEGALNFPHSQGEMHAHLEQWRAKFEKANHIALVGGGAVGIEIAGEIKDAFPKKKVTLIHNGKLLLNPTYPDKFRNAAARTALSRGIQLVLEDSVANIPEDGVVSGIRTERGVSIPADFVVATRGWTPNTAIFANIPGLLNERGQVKTLPTFQSSVSPHIFAVGDITDINEQKQLAKVAGHGTTAAANILNLLQGRPASAKYGGGFEGIALISGKYAGNMYLPFFGGMSLGNWVTSNVKGKGLLISMTRKSLGYN